jgi:outer membrane protein TolC
MARWGDRPFGGRREKVTALNARRALLQVSLQRQTAAIAMIAVLGGGWTTQEVAADEGR